MFPFLILPEVAKKCLFFLDLSAMLYLDLGSVTKPQFKLRAGLVVLSQTVAEK